MAGRRRDGDIMVACERLRRWGRPEAMRSFVHMQERREDERRGEWLMQEASLLKTGLSF
jgi:hypothetical protein